MSIAMKSTLALQQKSALACKVQRQSAIKPVARTRTVTKALSDVNVVVGGAFLNQGSPVSRSRGCPTTWAQR